MICKHCGCEISDDLSHCPFCGAEVRANGNTQNSDKSETPAFCPKCGTPTEKNASFCGNCGARLNTPFTNNTPTVSTDNSSSDKVLAILGIVFTFIYPLVGLILGIVALVKAKKANNSSNKTLAIVAVVCASIIMFLSLLTSIFAFSFITEIINEILLGGYDTLPDQGIFY